MSDVFKTEGTVKAVSKKDKGWTIKVDDKWYGCWKNNISSPNKEDRVEIEYTISQDGQWNNIDKIKVISTKSRNQSNGYDPTTMLVAYAKDEVVEMLKYAEWKDAKAPSGSESIVDAFWSEANRQVWDSYEFFKNKLKGGQEENENRNNH